MANLGLLNAADRVLFAGNAFEKQSAPPRMMMQTSKPAEDLAARSAWVTKMKGRFDLVYLATNARWYSTSEDLEKLLTASLKALADK